MTQQINLFNPLFLKQRKYFASLTMLQALGLVLLAMAAAYAWEYFYELAPLESKVADAKAAYERQARQLGLVVQNLPQAQAEAKVDEQIADLQRQINIRQATLQQLQTSGAAHSVGYSGYLLALARQTVQGVWLTGIHIGADGDGLHLSGRATQADLVPELVSLLNREPLMRGRPFQSLGMTRVASQAASQPAPVNGQQPGTATGLPSLAGSSPLAGTPPYFEFQLASDAINPDGGSNTPQVNAQAGNTPVSPAPPVNNAPGTGGFAAPGAAAGNPAPPGNNPAAAPGSVQPS